MSKKLETYYKIKNISRYLTMFGLCPGEEKFVSSLEPAMTKMCNDGLLNIETCTKSLSKKKVESDDEKINKECEVIDTDGWNNN